MRISDRIGQLECPNSSFINHSVAISDPEFDCGFSSDTDSNSYSLPRKMVSNYWGYLTLFWMHWCMDNSSLKFLNMFPSLRCRARFAGSYLWKYSLRLSFWRYKFPITIVMRQASSNGSFQRVVIFGRLSCRGLFQFNSWRMLLLRPSCRGLLADWNSNFISRLPV